MRFQSIITFGFPSPSLLCQSANDKSLLSRHKRAHEGPGHASTFTAYDSATNRNFKIKPNHHPLTWMKDQLIYVWFFPSKFQQTNWGPSLVGIHIILVQHRIGLWIHNGPSHEQCSKPWIYLHNCRVFTVTLTRAAQLFTAHGQNASERISRLKHKPKGSLLYTSTMTYYSVLKCQIILLSWYFQNTERISKHQCQLSIKMCMNNSYSSIA